MAGPAGFPLWTKIAAGAAAVFAMGFLYGAYFGGPGGGFCAEERRLGLHCLDGASGQHLAVNEDIQEYLAGGVNFAPQRPELSPLREGQHDFALRFGISTRSGTVQQGMVAGSIDTTDCSHSILAYQVG